MRGEELRNCNLVRWEGAAHLKGRDTLLLLQGIIFLYQGHFSLLASFGCCFFFFLSAIPDFYSGWAASGWARGGREKRQWISNLYLPSLQEIIVRKI